MIELFAGTLRVFGGVFVIIAICGAALMMGLALAREWRHVSQLVVFSVLLGLADRFLFFALAEAELTSVAGYLADTAIITLIALAAYRAARTRRMVMQYPWLYERTGPFTWRDRRPGP